MAGNSDLTVPVSISAGIHIGAIVILALGISFDDKPKPMQTAASAPAVQAVVIDQQKVTDRVEQLKKQKQDALQQEKARQAELERKALEARRERESEQEKIKTLEIQRKLKEVETQKANDAAKAAQVKQQQEKERALKAEEIRKQKEKEQKASEEAAKQAAEKRKQEEATAKKAQEERQRAEEERKRKEEAERKQREDADRKRKAEADAKARQEREMAEAMAAEQDSLSKTRNKQVLSEVDKYKAMIIATIQRNLVVDESMRGKSCRVFIRLAADGFVTTAQTLEGDQVVCRAAKVSINKAGRLPVSPEPAVYQQLKEINLTVSPEFN
ncbi:cell envelope integrity protein TolA [Shewanella ulleungensis]|uniref:Protein TolA n=1 Tax=Shewanella ulleungensis TaxID=2282699 RepID=A0ABQ2QKU6_9GAMM|nr:cell envelope integrity protein TolA [Shewanella ulleungensis]MCL1151128.1 cell envelope integrity protein TolA [Shewanella ulleungensis]GGP83147.1 protein TolA [Shewanella ulleungensis]